MFYLVSDTSQNKALTRDNEKGPQLIRGYQQYAACVAPPHGCDVEHFKYHTTRKTPPHDGPHRNGQM